MYIIGLQEMMIDGMGPKLSKIVPTLIVWSVCTARPENATPKLELLGCLGLEMVESGTGADGLECLGGLGPEMIQNCAGAGN